MVQAICSFKEESTVFCAAIRCMQEASIKNKLVNRKNRKGGLPLARIVNVCREAQTLVFALKSLLLVDCHRQDTTILTEVLVAAERLFFGNIRRETNDVKCVALQDTHCAQFLLQSLLLRRVTQLFLSLCASVQRRLTREARVWTLPLF